MIPKNRQPSHPGEILLEEYFNSGIIKLVDFKTLKTIPKNHLIKGKPINNEKGALVNEAFFTTFIRKDYIGKEWEAEYISPDILNKEVIIDVNKRSRYSDTDLGSIPIQIDGVIKNDVSLIYGFYNDKDDNNVKCIYLPLERFEALYSRDNQLFMDEFTEIKLEVNSMENIEKALRFLKKNNIKVYSTQENLLRINSIINTIKLIFFTLGLILLSISGIGIFNTIILSISERSKEIGIIKALGGSFLSIQLLFLMESLYIGIIGGLIGLAGGYIVSIFINFIYKVNVNEEGLGMERLSSISWELILMGLVIPIILSVLVAYIPSKKATKRDVLSSINK